RIAAQAGAEAAHARDRAASAPGPAIGSVDEVIGLVIRARVPGVALGEIVRIDRRDREPLAAEVVGFRGEQAVVLPLGDVAGVGQSTCSGRSRAARWRT